MLGQLIDVSVYHRIRRRTGDRHAWLRATGSTAVSQLIDSFVVLYIAFVLGPQHWEMSLFFAVGTLNYIYKMLAAVALIPLLYLARAGIRRYLGEARATELRAHARSEEHTSELQSLMRISYAVFCLKKKQEIDSSCRNK